MSNDRLEKYVDRIQRAQEEFDDLSAPKRADCLIVSAVAIVDGFCFGHTGRRATEAEFLEIARGAYRNARELVPLVKSAPPGQN